MKQVVVEKNAGNIYLGESPEYQVDSVINEVLKKLASEPFHFQRLTRRVPSTTIAKINYNGISSKKHIVRQYLDYSAAIETAYESIDSIIPFGKQIVLANLNDLYFAALDAVEIEYLDRAIDVEQIRAHSEFILDFIIQKLKNVAYESRNKPAHVELIDRGISVVVAHAFIECIIFETP